MEVASISLSLQPWGRFKTRRLGPWTPPEIHLSFAGIRLVSVNEFGQEAPPEEVWRHNHHRSHSGSLLIYKRLSMEYKISIKPANATERIPLVTGRDNKMEIQLAMKRRIRDGEWLAVQIDTTIPHVEVDLSQDVVPHLVNALAGISFCLAKDRAFEDPLKPTSQTDHESTVHVPIIKLSSSVEDLLVEDDGAELADEVPVQIEDNEESSSSSEEEAAPPGDVKEAAESVASSSVASATTSDKNKTQNEPIILLPQGMTISEKLTLSLAVYDFKLKGNYADNGHFELISKGCIGELIWPKVTREKGGYVQASVSYMTLQEKHGGKLTTLVSGGVKYDSNLPFEKAGSPLSERGRDETFPLYEDRVIRPDPLYLRYTFPAQAIGLKATIEFVEKQHPTTDEEDIRVLHEAGIDDFEIVLDSGPWSRIVRFVANEAGGGFDRRWSSGDWSKELNSSMLLRPSQRLNLEEHLQPTKQIFLDENQFISSDLFNVTCRMTKVGMRIPACVQESLTASAIVLNMDEGMLVVSSALPRTMLSGRIGTSINGDDVHTKGVINFPNDQSDVAYQLEQSEDPGDRQKGIMTSRAISTFRVQFTTRGASIKISPVLEFYSAKEPQEFLAPTDATMILCFEGEPPETEDSNLTKIVLFLSVLAHRILVNFDVEIIASAVVSLAAHYRTIEDCIQAISAALADSFVDESETEASQSEAGEERRLPRSIRGRRLRVRRQITRSRQTGGLSVAVGIQLSEMKFSIWRQFVPLSGPLRPSRDRKSDNMAHVPLIKLMDCEAGELELGLEASFKEEDRRIVLKGCLSRMSTALCDISRALKIHDNEEDTIPTSEQYGRDGGRFHLLELLSLGEPRYGPPVDPLEYAAAFRIEEDSGEFRSWSLSSDICGTSRLTFRPEEIESVITLLFEALMQPCIFSPFIEANDRESLNNVFPFNTTGNLLLSLIPPRLFPTDCMTFSDTVISLTTEKGSIPAKSLDKILRKALEKIPQNVHAVLVRTSLRDFGMFVPPESRIPIEHQRGFCLVIHSLEFLARYSHENTSISGSPLINVVATKDRPWSELVNLEGEGLFHKMKSRQSLSVAWEDLDEDGLVVTGDIVVPEFASGYSYANSRVLLEMPSGMAVDAVDQLDRFVFCMVDFRDRCVQTVITMSNILKTIRHSRTLSAGQTSFSGTSVNPVALACVNVSSSLQNVLSMVDTMNTKLKKYDEQVNLLLEEKEKVADKARLVSFMREKERLAALALVATQKTGWLRIGVASKTGQRACFTASLWPFWCSLRKGLLICYREPGNPQPLTMVSLKGASLVQLGGGNRKKDLRRGFGLVDSAGALHVLIAGTDFDYYGWIKEMKRSIVAYGGSPEVLSRNLYSGERGSFGDGGGTSDDGEANNNQPQQRLLGRTLSKAVRVAKASKQAVVDRRMRRSEARADSTDEDEAVAAQGGGEPSSQPSQSESDVEDQPSNISVASIEDSTDAGPNRRQQIRNRFVGMGQVTKRGLGSAMQMARQKGKAVAEKGREVAERRRQRHQEENETLVSQPNVPDESEPHSTDTSHQEKAWTCSSCTFCNDSKMLSCAMCDALRPDLLEREDEQEDPSFVAETNDISQQSNDDTIPKQAVVSDDTAGLSVRQRLGKAVRSVRQGNTDSASDPDRGTGRFSSRRVPNSGSKDIIEQSGVPEPVTVKRFSVSGPLVEIIHPFGENHLEPSEYPQKRLEKSYLVRVQVVESLSSTVPSLEPCKQDLLGPSTPNDCESDAPAKKADRNSLSNIAEAETPADEFRAEKPDPRLTIIIQTYQRTDTADWTERPCSTVELALSSVFELHSEISECVGKLPLPASFPTLERSESGGLGKSLAAAFGLSPLDTVRITGILLSGLLQYQPETGDYSVKSLSTHHGKLACLLAGKSLIIYYPLSLTHPSFQREKSLLNFLMRYLTLSCQLMPSSK